MALLEWGYLACFGDWRKRWHKCILSVGDYFNGDLSFYKPSYHYFGPQKYFTTNLIFPFTLYWHTNTNSERNGREPRLLDTLYSVKGL